MFAMVGGSPFWRTKDSLRFWNYTPRFIVSPNRHKALTAQVPPDAQLSAPALHLPTPRATG
jgi:hypothetical protein